MSLRMMLSLAVALLVVHSYAQECFPPTLTNGTYLHGNNVRTLIPASGSLFWDSHQSQYKLEGPDGGFATIFAHGLWLAAYDENDDLAVATARYGAAGCLSDYYPGPVAAGGSTSADVCGNYDRAWSVYRYQIEAHLADFADNGVIDAPLAAVVGWPGSGNEQFLAINGFALPGTEEDLAPFVDINGDGHYQPLAGEYPYVPQAEALPEQIVWSVFNTVGGEAHESGSPVQLKLEIQLLAWAFDCTDNPLLSNSIFTSYQLINHAAEPYTGFKFGLWTDFDLGCYIDDYLGSAPERNTYYAYNKFAIDDCDDFPSAGTNPPVQAITVLNRELGGFMYLNNPNLIILPPPVEPLPPGPQLPAEYYHYLSNRFSDGVPLTAGGDGYDPTNTESVRFAFPDDPNQAGGWSEYVMNPAAIDRRALGNISVPDVLLPGQEVTVDVAYSFHRSPGAGHLGNVSVMYENLVDLQAIYDDGFAEMCTQSVVCDDDCIWSGDLNADGIANHEDILSLGFGLESFGTDRVGPYNWAPRAGTSWNMFQFDGTDAKHLDANGDGQCTMEDAEKIFQHYNFTQPDYSPVWEYPVGDDFTFTRLGANTSLENLSPGELITGRIRLQTEVENLRAVAFTLEYDPQYFQSVTIISSDWEDDEMAFRNTEVPGALDFAYYLRDQEDYLEPQTFIIVRMVVVDVPDELLSSEETLIRFRNIKAYRSDGSPVALGAQAVRLQINDVAVGTEEPAWGAAVSLFPNPTKGIVYWRFGSVRPTAYALYDLQGRRLKTGEVIGERLDLHDLPAGVYQLQLLHDQGDIVRRVVKQ